MNAKGLYQAITKHIEGVYTCERLHEGMKRSHVAWHLLVIVLVFVVNFLILLNTTHMMHKDDSPQLRRLMELSGSGSFLNKGLGEFQNLGYLLSILPFFEQSFEFIFAIRYCNLVFGMLMILAVYWCGAQLFCEKVALIAAFLISVNLNILERIMYIAPENALVLFSTLSLAFLTLGLQRTPYLIVGLLFAVCAGLVKLNGFVILISSVCTLCILCFVPSTSKAQKRFYLTVVLLAALGIGYFHKQVYGIVQKEIHEVLNYLYVYDFEKQSSWDLSEYETPRYVDFQRKDIGIVDVLEQLLLGFLKEAHRYAVSFFTSIEWQTEYSYIGSLGYFIVPAYFYLLSFEKNMARRVFYICFSAVTYLSVVPRNAVGHGTARYTIIMAVLAYYFLAPFCFQFYLWVRRVAGSFRIRCSVERLCGFLYVVILLIHVCASYKGFQYFSFFPRFPEEYKLALEWLKTHSSAADLFAISSTSHLSFAWYVKGGCNEYRYSITQKGQDIPSNTMIQKLQKDKVRFMILDAQFSASPENPADYRYFFRSHIKKKGDSFKIESLPPEVDVKAQFPEKHPRIIILGWKNDTTFKHNE